MASKARLRLDQYLVQAGLAESRQKAQALIMSGAVLVDDCPVEKSGYQISPESSVRIRGEFPRFVSRGGDKLAGALEHFQIDLAGLVALDVGASTGGFTDCMLQNGVSHVYAIDVGYNQMAHQLRAEPRVSVMEKTHAKDLTTEMFKPLPSFATIDVSFISVRKILDFVLAVLQKPFGVLVLVKPQFELGRDYVSKGGVVKNEDDQRLAVEQVTEWACSKGLVVVGSAPSVLRGEKKGNQEYFLYLKSS